MRESHLQRMPSVLYSIVLWQSLQVWLGREWLDVGGCSYKVLGNKPPCSFTCTKPFTTGKVACLQFCQLCKSTSLPYCRRCLWETTALVEGISCIPPVAAGLLWFTELEPTPDGAIWVKVTILAFQWSYGSLLCNTWEPRSSWYNDI